MSCQDAAISAVALGAFCYAWFVNQRANDRGRPPAPRAVAAGGGTPVDGASSESSSFHRINKRSDLRVSPKPQQESVDQPAATTAADDATDKQTRSMTPSGGDADRKRKTVKVRTDLNTFVSPAKPPEDSFRRC